MKQGKKKKKSDYFKFKQVSVFIDIYKCNTNKHLIFTCFTAQIIVHGQKDYKK